MSEERKRKAEEDKIRAGIARDVRTMWMKHLNYGRSNVRIYLYKRVLFFVDELQRCSDLEEARKYGFEIIFTVESPQERAFTSPSMPGSIWGIPKGKNKGATDDSGMANN